MLRKVVGRYKNLPNPKPLVKKRLKYGLNPKKLTTLDDSWFPMTFFSKIRCRRPQSLIIGNERRSEKWQSGIKNLPKLKLLAQKSFKYGLKWFQETTHDDSWFPRPFFFSKMRYRGPVFLINGPKRCSEKWQASMKNLLKT